MDRLLSPKNDFVFKKLFTSDTGILTDLINSVLGILEWIRFFNRPEGDPHMKAQFHNPMINKALDALRSLSADETTRELAERREKALKDEAMFLKEAKRKGKYETAARLLKMNLLTIEQIAEATELDAREIENLKKDMDAENA